MVVAHANRLVALRVPFGPGFPEALFRLWDAGAAVLPVRPDLPPAEVAALLAAFPPESPTVAGTALVVPTSGTTGEPKGVVLSHAALLASAGATAERIGSEPGDRWLCCVPPSHIAGLMVLVRARLAGVTPVVLPRFGVAAVAAAPATLVSLVPTMLRRLLDTGVDLSRFRTILLGGGPAPADLVDRAAGAGARVVVTYGMTETCGGCVYDGAPLPGVRMAIGEDGEVLLGGPTLMDGYWGQPALTGAALAGGWFHTADAGEIGEGGRLRVLGRRDEMIISGGQKVAPAEVAGVLAGHPAVADVAVVGRPDPEWGHIVVAVVVPREGAVPSLAALRAWVKERLAGYKAPRALVLVPEVPRGPTGKPVGLAALVAGTQPHEMLGG